MERAGVSAIIMEDKIGLKKNSLFSDQTGVQQDNIRDFCQKIIKSKEAAISDDFMVISRIEPNLRKICKWCIKKGSCI